MKKNMKIEKKSLVNKLSQCFFAIMTLLLIVGCSLEEGNDVSVEDVPVPEWVDQQIINIDWSSRRGLKLDAINDVVIHYVGNPQSSAQANQAYFSSSRSAVSSHFIVGLEGEIIQCVPLDEYSSASNWRNNDTLSIEVCHPDETGKFTEVTYNALVELTAWICDVYNLDTNQIIRHYDITGKDCPRYFVRNEDEWELFKEQVKQHLETNYS